MSFELLEQFWNCSIDSLTTLTSELTDYLKEVSVSGHESGERRKSYLNALQMLIYICTQLAEACEIRDVVLAKAQGDAPAAESKKVPKLRSLADEGNQISDNILA